MPIGSGWSFRIGGRSCTGVGRANDGILNRREHSVCGAVRQPGAGTESRTRTRALADMQCREGAMRQGMARAHRLRAPSFDSVQVYRGSIGNALWTGLSEGPVRVALHTYGTPPSLQREPLLSVGVPFFGRSLASRAATGCKDVGDVPTHSVGWSPALHLRFSGVPQPVDFSPSRRTPILCSRP